MQMTTVKNKGAESNNGTAPTPSATGSYAPNIRPLLYRSSKYLKRENDNDRETGGSKSIAD
jgi:hypothetical protein